MADVIPMPTPPMRVDQALNEYATIAIDAIHELSQFINLQRVEIDDLRVENEILSRELAGAMNRIEQLENDPCA